MSDGRGKRQRCMYSVPNCVGPYGPTGFCCLRCAEVHDERPMPDKCKCDDCARAREAQHV